MSKKILALLITLIILSANSIGLSNHNNPPASKSKEIVEESKKPKKPKTLCCITND